MEQNTPAERIVTYIPYLDLLRAVSICAVVLLHSATQEWILIDHHTTDWHILNFYNGVSRFGVAVFVMISGALLLDGQTYSLEKLHKKKILRIVISFFFWSAIYALFDFLRGKLNFFGLVSAVVRGPMHLWFCCMIVGLYLITPFLRMINESEYRGYFLRLCLIFQLIVPMGLNVIEILNPTIAEILKTPIRYMSFSFTGGYVFYYILGNYLHNITLTCRKRRILNLLGGLGFVATIGLTAHYVRYLGKADELFLGNLTPNVMFEAIGVFIFARYCRFERIPDICKSIIKILSENSFGIYLVHVLFLQLVYPMMIERINMGYMLGIPITAIITILLSVLSVAAMKKIPVLKKYVL